MVSVERKCVGCNESSSQVYVERFVNMDNNVIFDVRKKAPGRGAYVHPNLKCMKSAMKHGFSKSFKTKLQLSDTFMSDFIQGVFVRVEETLRVSMRTGALFIGGDAVSKAMKNNNLGLLLIAQDAGKSVRSKYESNAERKSIMIYTNFDKKGLGRILGKEFISIVGVNPKKSESIHRDLEVLKIMGFWATDLNTEAKSGIGNANDEERILKEIVGREND